jgi:CheY-like chemotaxis protein
MFDTSEAANHILLADDNAVNAEVTAALLERVGYVVDIANDGEKAIKMATQKTYCAMILDCRMPVLDGYETASIIRAQGGHHRTVPIIALSGYEPRTHADKIEAAGMNDCLTKPVLMADLKAMLDKWLS